MRLRRHVINSDAEKQVLIGLITSDKICHTLKNLLDPKLFQLEVGKKVSFWIKDYYSLYSRAPGKDIQEVYLAERSNLDEEVSQDIAEFLQTLSEQYLENPPNEDYLLNQATTYLRKQSMLAGVNEAKVLLESSNGDLSSLSAAEAALGRHQKTTVENDSTFDPCDLDNVKFIEEDKIPLLKLKEPLGSFLGPLSRGYVVGIMGRMKIGKCLTGDSLIPLTDGKVKKLLEVIQDKDKNIITLNEKGKTVPGEISNYWENGLKDIVLLKTRTGREIKITPNHPLLTYKGWKEVKDLKPNDYIAVPKRIDFFGKEEWPEYKIKILSYLIAEGTIGIKGSFMFTNGEKEIRDDFCKSIKIMGDTTSKTSEEITVRIIKDQLQRSPRPTKTKIWLKSIGTKLVKSGKKEIPDIVFSLTKENLRLFLSILFTCDGSVYDGKIEYASASKVLIHQVQHLLLRFGIISNITKKKCTKNPNYVLTFREKECVLTFINKIGFVFSKQQKALSFLPFISSKKESTAFIDVFPPEATLKIKEKIKEKGKYTCYKHINPFYDSIKQSLGKNTCLTRVTVTKIAKWLNDEELLNEVYSDILWDKIVSITNIGKELTYDLTVPETHNFIANDIIAHNTWYTQQMVSEALENRLSVVFVSLEMPKIKLYKRFWQQMGSLGKEDGYYEFPIFDCQKNQSDKCTKSERTSHVKKGEEGYLPCVSCKDVKENLVTYLTKEFRPGITTKEVTRVVKGFNLHYGRNNFRMITYPMFTANLSRIFNDIEILEWKEGFIPDVVAIDYPGILSPEDSKYSYNKSEWNIVGETWKTLKQYAEEKQVIIFAPIQTDRAGTDTSNLKIKNTSGYVHIQAHLDKCLTLNQTTNDYERKLMRIDKITDRWDELHPSKEIIALTQLQCGQPLIRGMLVTKKKEDKK